MIKDVMVRLDGSAADALRVGTAAALVKLFDGQLIGLYVNVLPRVTPADVEPAGTFAAAAELWETARKAGNKIEERLLDHLNHLGLHQEAELRRFDAFSHEETDIVTREARSADVFVALRPNGEAPSILHEPEQLIESVLFGSGRHLYLVPPEHRPKTVFNNVLIAWNGSRESARAMAESMPYLRNAKKVSVVVVDEKQSAAALGSRAMSHLEHHGIHALLHAKTRRNGDVAETLMREIRNIKPDVVVMGGYGHSRLREWIFGSTTSDVLHHSPVPVVVAH